MLWKSVMVVDRDVMVKVNEIVMSEAIGCNWWKRRKELLWELTWTPLSPSHQPCVMSSAIILVTCTYLCMMAQEGSY